MTHLEELIKTKSHILWDWNGTLLDDVDLCVFTIAKILEKYELPIIDRESYRKTFSFPVIQYYKSLGFDFDKVSFKAVADEWMAVYQENLEMAALHNGAEGLLRTLKKTKKTQSILSAAKQTHLEEQLEFYGIKNQFDYIFGISDHYAKGKIERGKELVQLLDAPRSTMVLIGDTDHDKEVADELGIDLILLGDGHQHHERLENLGAFLLVDRAAKKKH